MVASWPRRRIIVARFYLVRHGETEWNRDGDRYCGRTDLPLSEAGRYQARRLQQAMSHIHFDRVLSSPLLRARETATIVSGQSDIEIQDGLIEIDFGIWEGCTIRQIQEKDIEGWGNWLYDPSNTPAGQKGETASDVFLRMNRVILALIDSSRSENTLLISHSTSVRILLAGLLEFPYRNYRKIKFDNAGVIVFEVDCDQEVNDDRDVQFLHINWSPQLTL